MSRDATFVPRSLAAPDYVRALFEPTDKVAILVRNRLSGRTIQRIAATEQVASPEFQEWLAVESARGSDIYIGMNPIKDGAHNRTKDNIKDIRHVYLDLDRDAEASLDAIRESTKVPPPNFVLDTSPGKHQVVWKVSGFARDEAESLLHGLADHFGGDPAATDSTRILRLPGFANQKRPDSFIVRAQQEGESIYTPRDFSIPNDSPEVPRRFGGYRPAHDPTQIDRKSQSERDWGYAKRALARGDDPELVIRRIEAYRGNEKHSNYARLTVEKARTELQSEAGRFPPNEETRNSASARGRED